MSQTIYVEGGGNGRELKAKCRKGFSTFFGQGFNRNALPARVDVENILKRDIEEKLNSATHQSKKGKYHKGNHSFDILARIRPDNVMAASPHAKRLIDTLIHNSMGEGA